MLRHEHIHNDVILCSGNEGVVYIHHTETVPKVNISRDAMRF